MEKSENGAKWALALLLAITGVTIWLDSNLAGFEMGQLTLALWAPVIVFLLALEYGIARRLGLIICLVFSFDMSLADIEFGFGLTAGLAFIVLLLTSASRETSPLTGATLLILAGLLGGTVVSLEANDSIGLYGSPSLMLASAGALIFSVSSRVAFACVILAWIASVLVLTPLSTLEFTAGASASLHLEASAPVSALVLALVASGLALVRKAMISRHAGGLGCSALGLLLIVLALVGPDLEQLVAPSWSEALALWTNVTSAQAGASQSLDSIVVTASRSPSPFLLPDFILMGLGAGLLGLGSRYRGLIALLGMAGSLAVFALVSPDRMQGSMIPALAALSTSSLVVVIAAQWVGNDASSSPHQLKPRKSVAAVRLRSFGLFKSWKEFDGIRRRFSKDPEIVRDFAADPNTSPLKLKLRETFYAGLPALVWGVAFTAVTTVQLIIELISTDQTGLLAPSLIYSFIVAALSYLGSAYLIPVLLLFVAACGAWPLTIGRAKGREARRLYLTFDAVHGLWPQAIASIGLTVANFGLGLLFAEEESVIGAIFAGAGYVLVFLMVPWLFWINAIKIPRLTGLTFGATGAGLFGRIVSHYFVTTLVLAISNGALYGVSYGLQYAAAISVRLAFGLSD